VETSSRVARISAALGVVGTALFLAGPALIHLGVLGPYLGFRLFLLGALAGLLALVLGAVGLWHTRASTGRAGRRQAVAGMLLGLALVAIVASAVGSAGPVPAINDITTDPDDPPVFVAATELPGNQGRDLSYPVAFAAVQRGAEVYADLDTLELGVAPAEAFARVDAAARILGWEVTRSDPEAGVLEATETSTVFRFVDDVVVRVRPANGGSEIDVRSKSRVGRGDVGANAARIRRFFEAVAKGRAD